MIFDPTPTGYVAEAEGGTRTYLIRHNATGVYVLVYTDGYTLKAIVHFHTAEKAMGAIRNMEDCIQRAIEKTIEHVVGKEWKP